MIEETGAVLSIEGDFAEVETRRQGACGSCAASGACGTSLLAGYFGRRPLVLRALNRAGAAPGDAVIVGVPEGGLMRASVVAYLIPLLGLMAGGITGQMLAPAAGEVATTLGGLAGLAVGLGWFGRFGRKHGRDPRYQAVVLRRVAGFGLAVQLQGPAPVRGDP
jgi:sigma-E factor negative regulatory protein RseC